MARAEAIPGTISDKNDAASMMAAAKPSRTSIERCATNRPEQDRQCADRREKTGQEAGKEDIHARSCPITHCGISIGLAPRAQAFCAQGTTPGMTQMNVAAGSGDTGSLKKPGSDVRQAGARIEEDQRIACLARLGLTEQGAGHGRAKPHPLVP
jgi:hypothetical protein